MVFFVSFGGGGWKFAFVIFTNLIPRRFFFFCIAKILVLMVIQGGCGLQGKSNSGSLDLSLYDGVYLPERLEPQIVSGHVK